MNLYFVTQYFGKGVNFMPKGRGWFGDSKGHSNAGRKGGLARSKNSKKENNLSDQKQNER